MFLCSTSMWVFNVRLLSSPKSKVTKSRPKGLGLTLKSHHNFFNSFVGNCLPKCTASMWRCRSRRANVLKSHMLQAKSLIFSWTACVCFKRLSFVIALWLHWLQLNLTFSCVILMCLTSPFLSHNSLSHSSHLYFIFLWTVSSWFPRPRLVENVDEHNKHIWLIILYDMYANHYSDTRHSMT